MTDFEGVVPTLNKALQEREYLTLTPVQKAVLASELGNADALVSAQTGSGKTVAFGLAIAPTILENEEIFSQPELPLALVVTPTRELAMQVKAELQWLYKLTGAQIASCVGGMDMRSERRTLDRGAHIVVGTPGRLRDHIERSSLDVRELKAVVLDEADEMLDLGFKDDLEYILKTSPKGRRTLLFSATVPKSIISLAKNYQRDAVRISTQDERKQHHDIEYQAITVAPNDKENAIINILRHTDAKTALVFCGTRAMVNHMTSRFANRGFSVVALSGELSQEQRTHALNSIRSGRSRICIATDVAARGIDIPDLQLVIHADLPKNHESLLHRSGRTGRAGKKGVSALIVPYQSRRYVDRLFARVNIEATWSKPPSVEDILKRDRERILEDPALIEEITEEEKTFTTEILSRHSPEQIAAALLRKHLAGQTAPEELLDAGPNTKIDTQNRNFKDSIWFSLSIGSEDDAEPRWLLPMLCRTTHLTKNDIGAIRVQATKTYIELSASCVDRFNEALGSSKKLEKTIQVIQLDARPHLSDSPQRRPSRGSGSDRSSRDDRSRGSSRNDKPRDRFKNDKPRDSFKNDKPRDSFKNDKPRDSSKISMEQNKVEEDFDKFIKQLDEMDTKPSARKTQKGAKTKIKPPKQMGQQNSNSNPSNDQTMTKRRSTKRKPMPSQPTKKSRNN